MAQKKKENKEDISVVAQLTLTYPSGKETVRSFETAWRRSLAIAREETPVHIMFDGFVRKD